MKILRKYENIRNYENMIFTILILLSVVSIILRLLPHMPNFAPIGALALFAGLYVTRKWLLLTPIAVMLISDIFVGFYDWKIMMVVYLSFLVYAFIGRIVKDNKSAFTVIGGTFAGALLFYLTTNFAVWMFGNWYPRTLQGLILCYEMALPFFRNSLMGDLFYVGVFVGAYELSAILFTKIYYNTDRDFSILSLSRIASRLKMFIS